MAIVNERDKLHARALELGAQLTGAVLTTEFVLVEVANFCSRGRQRKVFDRLVANLREAADVEILPVSPDLFQQGLELFSARPDKEWSLTDCTSFAVMRDRGLTDALTADHHFQQAGFNALLV